MPDNFSFDKKRIFLNSASGIAYKIVNVFVLVWLQAFLLKKISADEYSLYPVIMSISNFVFMIRMVFATSNSRYAVEAYAQGNVNKIVQITSTMFVVVLGIGTVILLLGLLFAMNIENVLTVHPGMIMQARIMMSIMIVSFVVQLVFSPFVSGIYIKQKFVAQNLINICVGFLRIILLFYFLFGINTQVVWVVIATESASLIGFIAQFFYSTRLVPELQFKLKKINFRLCKEIIGFGSWNLLGLIASKIKMSSDPIILNKFASSYDVTIFYLGDLFQKHIHQFIRIMTQPLVPVITTMHARDDHERLRNTFLRYGRYYTWIFFFVSVPLIVFRYEFINLYVGDKYATAASIMLLLLTESTLSLGAFILYTLAIATARIKEYSIRIIIIQIINVLLTLYLVIDLKMGAYGSALSTFITHMIGGPLLEVPLALKLAGINTRRYIRECLVPGNIPAIILVILNLFIHQFISPESWFELFLMFAFSCLCYLIVMYFVLQNNDKRDLLLLFNKLKLYKLSKILFGNESL